MGLLMMLGAVACFTVMVAFVKLLRGGGMSTVEVVVWRMAPGIPWVLFELYRRKAPLWPRRGWPVAARVVFGGIAMGTYFWAVDQLTLFQNTVLHLTQPVFVAVLAPIFIRERLRGFAVVALTLALAGAFVVVVPADALLAGTGLAALAAVPLIPGLVRLGSSLSSAFAHMSIRRATSPPAQDNTEPADAPETVVFHFTLWVSLVGLAYGVPYGEFASLPSGLDYGHTAVYILCMAAAGLTGQLLMSRAYARTEAPAVAIVLYAAIPMSLALDVAIWGAHASLSQAGGATLMLVAGVLLVRAGLTARRPDPL